MKRFRHIFSDMTVKMMLMAGMLLVSVVSVAEEGDETGVVIHGNVYGGGNLGDVGTYVNQNPVSVGNYDWKDKDGTNISASTAADKMTGVSTVNMTSDKAEVQGDVFGGGKGEATSFECWKGMVYRTSVDIRKGTVKGNVYGGGEVSRVEENTVVTIGAEGTTPKIEGSVFGAGAGIETHGYSALVRGTSTVTVQGSAQVWHNVYGGGEIASVGRYKVKTPANAENDPDVPATLPFGMPAKLMEGGASTVNILGSASIGKDDIENSGHVYGAGKGLEPNMDYDYVAAENYTGEGAYKENEHKPKRMISGNTWEYFANIAAYLQFVETLALSGETHVTIGGTWTPNETTGTITPSEGTPTIKGSVFGGSESGFVYKNTYVNILNGTIQRNAFGGGRGLESFAEAGRVRWNTNVTISGGTVKGNVYGGGNLGDVGTINKPADYNYKWRNTDANGNVNDNEHGNVAENNKVTGESKNTGVCRVTISGGTIGAEGASTANHASGHVFGAGRGSETTWWCEKAIVYATSVTISAGEVYGNVYGGGQVGRVEDDAKVVIGEENASGEGAAPTITGSVFGAGAGIYTHGYSALVRGNSDVTVQGIAQVGGSVYGGGEIASVGKFTVVGGLPKHPDSGGYCTVTIQNNAKIGTGGIGHNVFGACKGVDPSTISASERKSMQTFANRPKNADGTYKDENDGWEYYAPDHRFVWVDYTEDNYPAFLKTLALTSHPHVTISENASIYGSVYGGGERGLTLGDVDVDITGGTIEQDVYGGGALADTNAGNWDADSYTEVTGLTEGTSSVTGLYTKAVVDGKDIYTEITNTNETATSGTTYYSKGKWAFPAEMATKYTTSVDLTGGLVKGDAYGGGLGQKDGFNGATEDVEATVWGDIAVTLNGTAFDINYYTDEGYTNVVKSGRVFGCNNLNGSPQGDVTVTVNQTVEGNTPRTAYTNVEGVITDNRKSEDPDDHSYELAAVYGGGNLAPYTATGKKAHVIIYGCGDTSILTVYGGGNAAAVPETDVDIRSCFEIGSVFGGGNGHDKYKNDNGWQTNPGADVNGQTNTIIYGGTVHEAYGASNEKGTIYGDVVIDIADSGLKPSDPGYCELDCAQLVGAGKNADVNGDLKIVMGCKPNVIIPKVFGGADNANVNGDVEMTITSGNFTNVIGGNNAGGAIRGHIILNIEETTCIPLNIEHLYLCGYNAAYSQYGYYVKTRETESNPATGDGSPGEEAVLTNGKLTLLPRESDDRHKAVKTYEYDENGVPSWTVYSGEGNDKCEYAAPVLNVISCTSIGEVFGGGYGTGATVYGNPTVNINMIPGAHADEIDRDGTSGADGDADALGTIGDVYGGGDAAAVYGNTTVNIGTETMVSVYEFDNDNVNGEYVLQYEQDEVTPKTHTENVTGAYITGNVYGGGKLADVGKTHLGKDAYGKDADIIDIEGSTFVNIGIKKTEILDENDEPTGTFNYTAMTFAANAPGITIGGNVYGGGKGEALPSGDGAFRCSNAMVTQHTNVTIYNGTIGDGAADHGYVYGGGEKGRVQENTSVTIGCENDDDSAPVITGNVFGAGKGVNTHGYSALVRGNSFVTVQGNAKVKKSVYGGGEIASVGKYNINAQGLPESLANQGSGYCTVIVRDNAVIGPDAAMVMTATGYPDDMGHVFGAGKGVLPYEGYADDAVAWRTAPTNAKQDYLSKNQAIAGTDESIYLTYIETLGLATQTYVTIAENAFVKGSVYGGSENGYVQHDTQVNIQGNCQIGNGYVQMDNDGVYLDKLETPETPMGVNRPYTAAEWAAGNLIPDETNEPELYALVHNKYYNDHSLPECASWPYGQATGTNKYAPWDKYYGTANYDSKGGRTTADDGHTFYGNVFGGGSGVIPYRPGKWHPEAGSVGGNTVLNITGGHILTNIYGGNELTDVYGKCTVNFGGTATLGVPRTLKQIAAHPLTCYLFGAGKGDQRVLFNKKTNVKDVEMNITGGTIYGSVFGGGEDGHVHRDVTMTIGNDDHSGPIIGDWGTSYVDGNVFGGGRGFGADAYTAGNVAGSVKMEIKGGNILGSIYGGGRLGSVGYGLFESTNTANYGVMQDDDKDDEGNTTKFYKEGAVGLGRGHIDITISGGTIGNNLEYKLPDTTPSTGNAPSALEDTDFKAWTDEQWKAWKEHNSIPKTEFDTTTGQLTHTKGGNVFTGGMGNFFKQDGVTYINGVDWWKLGNAKSTKLTITGGTIKSNVYGGGELGQVVGHHTTTNAAGGSINASTEIIIQNTNNTIIGTEVKETITIPASGDTPASQSEVTKYTFGNVFGGGYGSLKDEIIVNNGTSDVTSKPKFIAGLVKEDTKIDMQGGAVKASIYGGGEMASVGESTTSGETTTATGSTYVAVSGGTVGIAPIELSDGSLRYFGGAKMGNVYGGGSGHNNTVRSGKIFKNTNVTISGSDTRIYHNIYGGGAYGTVGEFNYTEDPNENNKVIGVHSLKASGSGVATVTVTGGIIGYDGKENGMVFGSSRGDINRPGARDDHTAWVYDTHVTIGTSGSNSGPQINGTVYGSGENGHVFNDTEVTVNSGTIGIYNSEDAGYTVTSNETTYSGAEYPYRGNVYGGGCGTDKYYSDPDDETHDGNGQLFNPLAGIVYGTTTVNITGGRVVRNVYGAGAMGSVGKVVTTTTNNVTTTSITSGGKTTINISGGTVGVDGNNNGNVFGAARGDASTTQTDVSLVENTSVNISSTADVKGSVYGGGETGDVLENTEVNVCAQKQTSGETVTYVAASGTPTIGGNVYGGGKGSADNFTCDKAMVGLVDKGVTGTGTTDDPFELQPGGTTVRIYNGTVGTLVGATGSQTLKDGTGNVYGGGEIARVERNTVVEIGAASGTTAPIIQGSVFAAGAGLETHGYSALVRGTSTVTVQGSAQVKKNVYGGGEKASVGRYKVKIADGNPPTPPDAPATLPAGMPYGLKAGGASYVNILGSAIIGTDNVASTGHIFGAGQGIEPTHVYNGTYTDQTPYTTRITNSKRMANYSSSTHTVQKRYKEWDYYVDGNGVESTIYVWEYFPTKPAYLQFIETLAISSTTHVTIGGGTVKGSVYGGSESGFVYQNTDVKIQGGIVKGDAFGGGLGLESYAEAGRVRWNTNLAVSGGAVQGNVYGGGKLGDVGTIYKPSGSYDYIWKNTDANGNNLAVSDENHNYENTLGNNAITTNNKNTGVCTVSVSGGTIGLTSTNEPAKHGNVFGAGRGSSTTWWCEKAIAYATNVSVKDGTVYGTVYGGGEVGRVEDDAKVTIGTPGETGANKPNITGSVFGGGAGLATHGYSALVRGDAAVTVQGAATVVGNVYGGGEVASVGRFKVDKGLPTKPKGGGTCTVVIKDNAVIGDVYGSCKGVTPAYVASGENRSKSMQLEANAPAGAAAGTTWDYYETYPADYTGTKFIWRYYTEDEYLAFLPTLGLASNTHVTIGGGSIVNGSVFGGGQRGLTLGGVDVNITGGTVSQDVYGGGALANSNSSHWHEGQRTEYVELDELYKGIPLKGYYRKEDDTYTLIDEEFADGDQKKKYYAIFNTNVNLTGGTVEGNVYGGGLGQLAKDAVNYTQAEADAYNTEHSLQQGDPGYVTTANVKTPAQSAIAAKVYGDVSVKLNEDTNNDDCEVKGTIFGCNNLNGSPQNAVTVHIYKTVHKEGDVVQTKPTKNNTTYELKAVYGGGNLAAYYPDDATSRASAVANVIIDGCDLTSIKTVYGGGNAASVPATEVVVNGTYEIGQAFGGGNGADNYQLDGVWYQNQGANVGLKDYTHWETSGTTPGTEASPYYLAINNTTAEQGGDASTKENRIANYSYGVSESLGRSHISIFGGTVHEVYGGSNRRGNVRDESRTTLDDHEECSFTVTDAYGGGNNASQDGDAVLEIGCISGLGKAYGGASYADVNGNVVLDITNGTYGRVFGGNDQGGLIRGSITVNIEETGCRPIIIGELYGGGNLAYYSVYGYDANGNVLTSGENPVADPVVNVKSFTSIGTIYGGGYGEGAVMVGDPQVNINVTKGKYAYEYNDEDNIIGDNYTVFDRPVPSHAKGAIGAINNVFGGGNAAEVIGTPHVNIGTLTGEIITLASKKIEDSEGRSPSEEGWIPSYQLATVEGVDIRGNVFGAGNNANVTGDTEVVIGKNNNVKTYRFTSYDAAENGNIWSSGLAQTTGVTKKVSDTEYAEVVILTNGKYGNYVGNKYYVDPNATQDGNARTELKNADGTSASLYVAIKPFVYKTYSFTSYGASSGGDQYSTGTAAPTGNFKTFSSKEYMQIVVLTNPGETSWVGKTFYVPVDASTNGSTRTQLRKANGDLESVWVTITE